MIKTLHCIMHMRLHESTPDLGKYATNSIYKKQLCIQTQLLYLFFSNPQKQLNSLQFQYLHTCTEMITLEKKTSTSCIDSTENKSCPRHNWAIKTLFRKLFPQVQALKPSFKDSRVVNHNWCQKKFEHKIQQTVHIYFLLNLTEKIKEEHKNLQVSTAAHVYNVLKVEKQGFIKKAKGFVHGNISPIYFPGAKQRNQDNLHCSRKGLNAYVEAAH